MLLQTNSYIVPKDKRSEHARLLRKFRQTLLRLGCDHFEVYEQVGANWSASEATGRFVQIMRFRDRKHQQQVQAAEKGDPMAQQLIGEFCALINFPYQQQQGLFAVGFYRSGLPDPSRRPVAAGAGAGSSAVSGGAAETQSPPAPPDAEARTAASVATPVAEADVSEPPVTPTPDDGAGVSLLDMSGVADNIPAASDAGEDPAAGGVPSDSEPEDEAALDGLTFDDPHHAPDPAVENRDPDRDPRPQIH